MKKKASNKISARGRSAFGRKKETIIAIILGLIGIFLVGTGVLACQKSLKRHEETLKQNAENAIAMCKKQFDQAKNYGIKLVKQEKILKEAKIALADKRFREAKNKANTARLETYDLYQKQLTRDAATARKYLKKAEAQALNTTAKNLLKQAKQEYYRGHFRKAIQLAKQSISERTDSVASTTTTTTSTTSNKSTTTTTNYYSIEGQIIGLINSYRTSQGKSALASYSTLSSRARTHSSNMATQGFFDHRGFPSPRLSGIAYSAAAENIALRNGGNIVSSIVNGWIASSGHRANMLGNYTKVGVGVAKSSSGTYYATACFIR